MNNTELIFTRSIALAQRLHANDYRKDGETPYMVHVCAVIDGAGQVAKTRWPGIGYNQILLIQCVAALHDVVEDHPTEITYDDIFRELSADESGIPMNVDDLSNINTIIGAVKCITKKNKGEESYDSYVRRVLSNEWAKLVKIADLEHNMSDLPPGSMRDKYELTKWVLENVKVTP